MKPDKTTQTQTIKSAKAQKWLKRKSCHQVKKGIEKREKKKKHLLLFSIEKLMSRDFSFSFRKHPVSSYLEDQTTAEAWDTKFRKNTELKTCF